MNNKEPQDQGLANNNEAADNNETVDSNETVDNNEVVDSSEAVDNNEVASNRENNAAVVSHAPNDTIPPTGGNKGAKSNPFWMIASIVLAIALVAVIIFPIGGGGKSDTVATVNSANITKDDLLNTLQEYYGESIVNVLDRMIMEELVSQEAKAKNVTLTDADVDAEIAALKIDYGTEENFQYFLSNYGMTEEDLKKELKLTTQIRLLLQDSVDVTDEKVQAYFDENKAALGTPEDQVRASHILVTDKDLAEDILAQLKNGADFAELAMQYGTDATKERGGDLGYFAYGAMIEEFSKVAFDLEVNELSDLVETQHGYHIILKTDFKPAAEADYDTFKNAIKIKLINEDIYANNSNYTEELRAKANITNNLADTSTAPDAAGVEL